MIYAWVAEWVLIHLDENVNCHSLSGMQNGNISENLKKLPVLVIPNLEIYPNK